jgi:cell division protein FtsZ
MDEVSEITNFVTRSTNKPSMIWGVGIDESLGDAVSVTIVATCFSNANCFDPNWNPTPNPGPTIENPTKGDGKERIVLDFNNNGSSDKTVKTKKQQPVVQQKYFVRETSAATQTKIKWDYPDTITDIAVEPMERQRAIPLLVDENMNFHELENVPALVRKRIQLENQLSGTEKEVSRYTLGTDKKDNFPRIRDNNPYLYDLAD